MTRWGRINLGMGMLAIVLLAVDNWPTGGAAATPLTDMLPQDIDSLRVERGNRLTLAFERDPQGWRMTHPLQATAEPHRVARLLAVATAPTAHCNPVADDAAAFGIASPTAVLQLDDQRLAFGDREATQQARYVRVGDQVCVIDDAWFHLLALPASHFARD
jgi:hypothetical protein